MPIIVAVIDSNAVIAFVVRKILYNNFQSVQLIAFESVSKIAATLPIIVAVIAFAVHERLWQCCFFYYAGRPKTHNF